MYWEKRGKKEKNQLVDRKMKSRGRRRDKEIKRVEEEETTWRTITRRKDKENNKNTWNKKNDEIKKKEYKGKKRKKIKRISRSTKRVTNL